MLAKLSGPCVRISDTSSSLVTDAISEGIAYTQHAIVTAEPKGEGHGPLNHGYIVARRALPLYVRLESVRFPDADSLLHCAVRQTLSR